MAKKASGRVTRTVSKPLVSNTGNLRSTPPVPSKGKTATPVGRSGRIVRKGK